MLIKSSKFKLECHISVTHWWRMRRMHKEKGLVGLKKGWREQRRGKACRRRRWMENTGLQNKEKRKEKRIAESGQQKNGVWKRKETELFLLTYGGGGKSSRIEKKANSY